MEAVVLIPCVLGLLLLPLLAVALCVRCRELPGSYDTAASDSLTPSSIVLKRPPTVVPWPSATSYAPVTSYPPLSQPDLLPIPRSPQPHRMLSSRPDSAGANSVASYENEEPACEDEDEDEEEDYHNEGYLEVLPDSTPATSSAVPLAPVPSNPGLRDSAFSSEPAIPDSGRDPFALPCPAIPLTARRPPPPTPLLSLSPTPIPQGGLLLSSSEFLTFSGLFPVPLSFPFIACALSLTSLFFSCLSHWKLFLGLWCSFLIASCLVSRRPRQLVALQGH
ncbi:linker for activation of T-cells family member 1 isoform X2 [Mirounga leonina]|uniref:linker for activation of T-cells family member 1 isoform X2 n=1 Tax=Mirounga leonina TaxID=9715 RepID=UPI00156BFF17|nr:linker for activation of T-cells family member 1 isoform X2 [Mirounga leonina]